MIGCAGVVALLFGGGLGWRFENHFGVIRLWTYAIFLHGPVLLAATAVLWRRTRPWLACGAALAVVGLIAVAADALADRAALARCFALADCKPQDSQTGANRRPGRLAD